MGTLRPPKPPNSASTDHATHGTWSPFQLPRSPWGSTLCESERQAQEKACQRSLGREEQLPTQLPAQAPQQSAGPCSHLLPGIPPHQQAEQTQGCWVPAERCDKPAAPQHVTTTADMAASLDCAQPASACRGLEPQILCRVGGHQYSPTPKKNRQPVRTQRWEPLPLWCCCRSGAAQGSSGGPITFSIVASLVTS